MGTRLRRTRGNHWPPRLLYLMLICALLMLLVLVVLPPRRTVAGSATINTNTLRGRSGPCTGCQIIALTSEGESVTVLDRPIFCWYHVQHTSLTGWALARISRSRATAAVRPRAPARPPSTLTGSISVIDAQPVTVR